MKKRSDDRWRQRIQRIRLRVLRFRDGLSPRVRLSLVIIIVLGNAVFGWKHIQDAKRQQRNAEAGVYETAVTFDAQLEFTLGAYRYQIRLLDRFGIVSSDERQVVISIPDQRFSPQFMFSLQPEGQKQSGFECVNSTRGPSICYQEETRPNGNGPLYKAVFGYVSWGAQTPRLYFTIDDYAELLDPDPGLLLQFVRLMKQNPA